MSTIPTGRSAPEPGRREELRLPWDEQAERAVLGAILLDPASFDAASELIRADDFHRPAHREIFKALVTLSVGHEAIDPVTLRHELEKMGSLDLAGGSSYLASLIDGLPRATHVTSYAKIVKDRSLLRRLMRVTEELGDEAAKGKSPAIELIDRTEGRLFELSDAGRHGGFEPLATVGKAGIATLEKLSVRREAVTGVPTGFARLDKMTSGFQPGEMVVIAARPSMGKTALAINMAQHAAREDTVVGVFSLEMSSEQLFIRMLSSEAMVSGHKLRTGNLDAGEWERIMQAYDTLSRCRIFIDDTPGISPMEVRSKARRLKKEEQLGLIVLDYLQLMRGDERVDSRQQEISEISRALKGIAKELKLPIIALSQLSRAPDQRVGDHRPQLSDLRESGAIEQDADLVMFIFRPEVYEKDPEKVIEKELEGKAELILAKQRNGPTGTVPLFFVKEYTQFQNRADDF